jgi:hypothetical protein
MAEPATYELVSISDLLLVPMDRRETCVRDLLLALALADLSLGDDGRAAAQTWTWADDGDPSCSITINGEAALTLNVTVGK